MNGRNRRTTLPTTLASSLLALLFALLMGGAFAQDAQTDAAGSAAAGGANPDETVIEIGEEDTITNREFEQEFDRAMRSLAAQQGLPYTAETRELFDRFRSDFLTQYATQQALLREAEQRGITVEDAELDQQIQTAREGFGGQEQFDAALQEFGYGSEAEYREAARQGMMAQRVVDELEAGIELTDEDVQTYFEQNQNLFGDQTLEQVRPEVENQLRSERLNQQFADLRRQYGIETYPDRLGSSAAPTDGISQEDIAPSEDAVGDEETQSEGEGTDTTEGAQNTDAETDTDMNTETDTATDTETDTETDTQTDTDTDTDTDTEDDTQ